MAKGRCRVRWIDLRGAALDQPFFSASVSAFIRDHDDPEMLETGEGALLDGMNEARTVQPAAFIFHVSRCGSTIVSNLMQRLPDTVVISEAQPVSAALWSYGGDQLPPRLRPWKKMQPKLLEALVWHYGKTGNKLIVKFNSWNVRLLPMIREIWPSTPVLLIYRDPVEVLASLIKTPPQWAAFFSDPGSWPLMTGRKKPSGSLPEFYANALRQWFSIACRNAAGLILLDYADINPENLLTLCMLQGGGDPATIRPAIESVLAVHSKSGNKEPFVREGPGVPGMKGIDADAGASRVQGIAGAAGRLFRQLRSLTRQQGMFIPAVNQTPASQGNP